MKYFMKTFHEKFHDISWIFFFHGKSFIKYFMKFHERNFFSLKNIPSKFHEKFHERFNEISWKFMKYFMIFHEISWNFINPSFIKIILQNSPELKHQNTLTQVIATVSAIELHNLPVLSISSCFFCSLFEVQTFQNTLKQGIAVKKFPF
jgi:hypothetical protein